MAGSSIHIAKASKSTPHNFYHNTREGREPSYLLPREQREANEYDKTASEAMREFKKLIQERAEKYKQKTGQNIQKKTRLLYSTVVNLEDHHTLKDLEPLKNYLENYLNNGEKMVLSISIHRDEGTAERKNYHAHFELCGLDSNGNGIAKKLNKKFLTDLQAFTAKTLGMEYRQGSERRHLDHKDYREFKKLERQAVQKIEQENTIKNKVIKAVKEITEAVKKFLLTNEIVKIEQENTQLKRDLKVQEQNNLKSAKEIANIKSELTRYKKEEVKKILSKSETITKNQIKGVKKCL
jgi:hypothetical protein